MRIAFINPNSTQEMTDNVLEVARSVGGGIHMVGYTNFEGPPAIQGQADGDAAIPGVLKILKSAIEDGADAIVIACFDDTGLMTAQAQSEVPVLGIGQSAYTMATLLGKPFSVVTSLAISIPVIEANIERSGFTGQCVGVHASGLPVLEIDEGSEETCSKLASSIVEWAETDQVDTIVLGCAGMAHLLGDLTDRAKTSLIDGVRASVFLATAASNYREAIL